MVAPIDRYAYQVFLSFRGEDTRKNFTDHLYSALDKAGIRTFRDDDEIERGEHIKSVLEKAIQQSRSSVIVMSKDYASSGWCLDELAMIVERNRTSKHKIIPVFYDVDPAHVREQTNSVAESFEKHEKRIMEEIDEKEKEKLRNKMRVWKDALSYIADPRHSNLRNQGYRHESKFIREITKEVMTELNFTVYSANSPPYPTGLESRVQDVNSWLEGGMTNVMVICGMGGIGKTTIAKIAYIRNQNFDMFEGSSFLGNIRETAKQPNGLLNLQNQLFSDILQWRNGSVNNVDEGITRIKEALCHKKVLVVLDDVDEFGRVTALLGSLDWFHRGSKIIITTRHEQLLKANEVSNTCTVKELKLLNDDEALCLFSWNSFGQDKPKEGYEELTKSVLQYCAGLPLALEALGSSLCDESVDVWESKLAKWRTHLPEEIHSTLKISYDSLDDDEKYLFLDIACFFVGKDKDYTVTVLEVEEEYFPKRAAIQNLLSRGLIKVDEDSNNKLIMHRLLREMGRKIICQDSPKEPGKCSRLCGKDAFNVLREEIGTEKIEGLSLSSEDLPADSSLYNEGRPSKRICQGLISRLPFLSALRELFSEPGEADFKTEAFSPMRNLRFLELNNVRLSGGYGKFPKKLRWLCWHGFPLKYMPSDFPVVNLLVLDLCNSSLENFWKKPRFLGSLKILDLSCSIELVSTPDFSFLPNLERLILEDCINLVAVHESIGELKKLVLLNLRGCKSLQKLPERISQLQSLELISEISILITSSNHTRLGF